MFSVCAVIFLPGLLLSRCWEAASVALCVMGSRLAPADTQRLGQYYDDEFSPGRLPSATFSNPAIHLSHTQPPGEPYLAYGGITFLRRCASGLLTIARFGGRRCLLLSV